ncbi:MAG: Ig-like domain-containing protein [Halobacteriota archaeon]
MQKNPTTITLTVSKANPVVGEQVTFTATLKRWNPTTKSYVALPYKSVTVWYQVSGVWKTAVAKTNAYGTITWPQSWTSAGSTADYASFGGDATYAKSAIASKTVTVRIQTKVTLNLAHVLDYDQWVAYGRLTDLNGNPVNRQEVIKIHLYAPDPGHNTYTTTDTTGHFSVAVPSGCWYQASFTGDDTYGPSDSIIVKECP